MLEYSVEYLNEYSSTRQGKYVSKSIYIRRQKARFFFISAFKMYVLHFGHFSKTGKTRVSHRVKMMTR